MKVNVKKSVSSVNSIRKELAQLPNRRKEIRVEMVRLRKEFRAAREVCRKKIAELKATKATLKKQLVAAKKKEAK
jgi:hypothetical protein